MQSRVYSSIECSKLSNVSPFVHDCVTVMEYNFAARFPRNFLNTLFNDALPQYCAICMHIAVDCKLFGILRLKSCIIVCTMR